MNETPRLRSDLEAQPVEEMGIKYFDVRDPRSGNKMRLYDFEWLIAGQLDGSKPFDEVAQWAAERFGFRASAADLKTYAGKLQEYGFFDATKAGERNGASTEVSMDVDDVDDEPEIETAPEKNSSADAMRATDVAIPVSRPEPVVAPPPVVAAPRPTPVSRPEPEPRREPSAVAQLPKPPGPSGSVIALFLVIAIAVAGGVYVKFFSEGPLTVKVEVAAPKEVTRLYDNAATVKLSQPQTLSFSDGGTVAEVVAKGTAVKAGQVVASLEGGAKFDKEIQDVKDRLAYYQKKVESAKAKGAEAEAKEAEGKVAEKQKLLNDTEAKASKVRLTAPAAGTVTDVMVTAGGEAKAGAPAVKLGDSKKVAELKVAGPDAATLKPGASVSLQGKAGIAAGRVQSNEGGVATIELLDDVLKDGEQPKVVKSKLANIIKVPVGAVTKDAAGDVVYVLVNGEVKQRKVNVADRTATEALLSGGLAPGDSIIVASPTPLKDGLKATAQ